MFIISNLIICPVCCATGLVREKLSMAPVRAPAALLPMIICCAVVLPLPARADWPVHCLKEQVSDAVGAPAGGGLFGAGAPSTGAAGACGEGAAGAEEQVPPGVEPAGGAAAARVTEPAMMARGMHVPQKSTEHLLQDHRHTLSSAWYS